MLNIDDLKLGDKVNIALAANCGFYIYQEGVPPGPRDDKKDLLAGNYEFTVVKNPGLGSSGMGEHWLATEYPMGSGIWYGTSARFLLNRAKNPGSNITLLEAKKDEPPPTGGEGI